MIAHSLGSVCQSLSDVYAAGIVLTSALLCTKYNPTLRCLAALI